MSWLTVNGISLAKVAAHASPPEGSRRDIGNQSAASDGSTVVTRQTRKRDLKITTKLLSGAEAFAWESLIVGDGHVWSFDSSFYSSKGFGPTLLEATLASATPAPKYGAKYAKLTLDQRLSYALGYTIWTVSLWAYDDVTDAGNPQWRHLVMRSDSALWVNGVSTTFTMVFDYLIAEFTAGTLLLTGSDPGPSRVDDLVVCPYLWLDDWPAQVYAAGRAFGPTPYLTAAGDLVPEAATRKMACKSVAEKVAKANLGAGMKSDLRTLELELIGA